VPKRADGRPTVGLVIIAKGDEASTVIARAIVSAKKIGVDCTTVVCDAQDKVAEVSRHLGADVFIRPSPKVDWEQGYGIIAGARNEALTIAERRTDFVLIIDADDWVEGELPTDMTADGYEMLVHDGGMVYPRIQLFRCGRGFRYHGIRHEHLVMGGQIQRTPALRYFRGHSSYGWQDQDSAEVKYSTHAKDLTKWMIDHPDDARAQFYLARSYQDAGRVPEAIVEYEKRLGMMNGWDEERFYSAFQIGLMAMRKGEDPTHALLRAHEIRPTRAEPLVVLAQWHRDEKRKHFSTAYAFAQRAAAIPMPNDGLFMQTSIYEFEAVAELAICAYWVGKKAESLEIFRKIAATCAPQHKKWAENMVAMCAREVAA
jgi:tetratricopeptide (TPR) repeat protein